MLNVNFNEEAALRLVLRFLSVEDLITYAMHGLNDAESPKAKDNANVCFNALEAFLKQMNLRGRRERLVSPQSAYKPTFFGRIGAFLLPPAADC